MPGSPLIARLAPTASRGSAPPRPGPAPPGISRAPSPQPRRRAGQRSGGGGSCGGSEGGGGGGSGRRSPTLRRQTGRTTEAGPQEVSAPPGRQGGSAESPGSAAPAAAAQGWRARAGLGGRALERQRGQLRAGHPLGWASTECVSCFPGKVLFFSFLFIVALEEEFGWSWFSVLELGVVARTVGPVYAAGWAPAQ